MKDDVIEKTIEDIKNLKIQGATNVAKAALTALISSAAKIKKENLKTIIEKLKSARLTEPMLINCLDYIFKQMTNKHISRYANQFPISNITDEKLKNIFIAAKLMLNRLNEIESEIIRHGQALLKPNITVVTHCHSSTIEKILIKAWQTGKIFKVYLSETRPLFQGRITAENLAKAGISVTLVTDSQINFLISKQDKTPVDLILIGCDAISLDGSCLNKVGSYGISLSAYQAKIPLYIAGTLLKVAGFAKKPQDIEIEKRPAKEIWPKPLKNVHIFNPAFDIVPKEYITNYITEFGAVNPQKIKTLLRKNYPWIINKQIPNITNDNLSYLHLKERVNSKSHIFASFYLKTAENFRQSAEEVAAESSIGTWTKVTTMTEKIFRNLGAKITEMDKKSGYLKIAYPLDLFESANIPQLLSSVAGNIFGMKIIKNLRLQNLDFPEKYVKSFPGPALGIDGWRKISGVSGRALIGCIIKPKMGLSTNEHVKVAMDVFRAGVDFVKDDENLTDQKFNPFAERTEQILKKLTTSASKYSNDTYHHSDIGEKIYAFNVTAETEKMIERVKLISKYGGNCVMVDIITVGFAALQTLRKHTNGLLIHAHRAMHGALTHGQKHGISMLVFAKLARLAGVDSLHTGTIIGKMEASKKDVLKINKFLQSEWYGLKTVMPVASGGLSAEMIPALIKLLGKDVILNFGGGIHKHPKGSYWGAKEVMNLIYA